MTELLPSAAAAAVALPEARNPYLVYVAGLRSEASSRTLAGCLDRIAALTGQSSGLHFPWHELRFEHVALIRTMLLRQTTDSPDGPVAWAPAYVNKHLSALRGVLKAAWRLGLMTTDDYMRAKDVANVGGERLPAGRSMAAAELAALLRICDGSAAGVRDAALLGTLYSTGMRRAELAAARLEHYDPAGRALRVIGKRDKERLVFVHENVAALLGRWIVLKNRRSGPLFFRIHRSGALPERPEHLSPSAVGQLVNRRRLEAGLPPLTPHDFRRTFIGDLLDEGVDIATVQAMAGHASPVTTARYDRRPDRVRRDAVDRLTVPRPSDL